MNAPVDGDDIGRAHCADCGLAYADRGWVDCIIPDEHWEAIGGPTADVLCLTCMTRRLVAADLRDVPVEIRSGPYRPADVPATGEDELRERLLSLRIAEVTHAREVTIRDYMAVVRPLLAERDAAVKRTAKDRDVETIRADKAEAMIKRAAAEVRTINADLSATKAAMNKSVAKLKADLAAARQRLGQVRELKAHNWDDEGRAYWLCADVLAILDAAPAGGADDE